MKFIRLNLSIDEVEARGEKIKTDKNRRSIILPSGHIRSNSNALAIPVRANSFDIFISLIKSFSRLVSLAKILYYLTQFENHYPCYLEK